MDRHSSLPLLGFSILLSGLLLLPACSLIDGGDALPDPPDAEGLAYARSDRDVDETFSALDQALESAGPISVGAHIDHAANAASVGLDLRPTRLILFGNPLLGTPLMQQNPTTGIDLPQKVLVYKNAKGEVFGAYNTTDYLAARHRLTGAETLTQIAGALDMFVGNATGGDVRVIPASGIEQGEGLVTVSSAFSVDETIQRLREAIENAGPLSILAEVDHQANAQSVGLELPPIRLMVFGNPSLGTPLMQSEQSIGIDLPQKMLVYENASGSVHLAYNDPFYLAERHGIEERDDVLTTIQGALEGLAEAATQP